MPELPEVETIRRGLEKFLVGHTIAEIDIRLPKQLRGNAALVIGGKVIAARRFGKGLIIDLDNGYSLGIHVKMTGQLLYVKGKSDLPDKYTHVVFYLDRDAVLFYRDVRQFGWIHILPTKAIAEHQFFKNLGKEPLKDLTLADFQSVVKKYKTPIKILLLDQSKIAGIGNIYANDALYRAKIHPQRSAASLSSKEAKALFEAIEYVLQKGIEVGGASEWHYVDVLGGKGQYQNFFEVYHQTGKPCKRCGTPIEKMVLGGRGTFFCPACQKTELVERK